MNTYEEDFNLQKFVVPKVTGFATGSPVIASFFNLLLFSRRTPCVFLFIVNLTSQRLWRTYLKYLLLWITTICAIYFLDLQDDALPQAEGGLMIRNLNQAQLIDFNDFRAAGVVSNPDIDQLDSSIWRIQGLSDGVGQFGGNYSSGDWVRGAVRKGVRIGGIYAFDLSFNNALDWALGFQPTGSDLSAGSVAIRIVNQTSYTVDKLIVGFDLLFRNNEERSTKISLSYGPDDIHFLSIPNAAWVSEDASVDGAWWERKSCEFELDQLVVPSNGSFYCRWQIEDFAGSGRRDEIAIDNVSIQLASTTETVPEPESLVWGIVLAGVLVGAIRARKK